jgi:flagellar basal body-associated protein FliL
MCRILTNIDAYKKKNVTQKKVKTECDQKDMDINNNAASLFKSKTKKRLTKEISKATLKKQKFVFS